MSYLRYLFVFTSKCLQEGSCLIYVICICLRIDVSKRYCVVFFYVWCTLCYQFLWTVHFLLALLYSLPFIKYQYTIKMASFYDFYIGFCWNCTDRCDIFWYFILLIIMYRGNRSQNNIFSMYQRTRGFISDSCSHNCSKLDQTGECQVFQVLIDIDAPEN